MMFLLRVTRDEVMGKMNKENQVNGSFEVPNRHSTKTTPYNDVYGCMYIFDVYLIDDMPAGIHV